MFQRARHSGPWPHLVHPVMVAMGSADADAHPADLAEVVALVYRQMRVLTGRRDVDDLAQTAAEHAIRSLPSFAGRSKLSTWTFRICYLTVRKHDRSFGRWLRRFALTDDGELPERVTPVGSPHERFVEDERIARVRRALEQLSARQRAVVILHDLEGCSIDEVAEIVAAKPVAVRSRLRDGRKKLAGLLTADPYFGDDACRGKDAP